MRHDLLLRHAACLISQPCRMSYLSQSLGPQGPVAMPHVLSVSSHAACLNSTRGMTALVKTRRPEPALHAVSSHAASVLSNQPCRILSYY